MLRSLRLASPLCSKSFGFLAGTCGGIVVCSLKSYSTMVQCQSSAATTSSRQEPKAEAAARTSARVDPRPSQLVQRREIRVEDMTVDKFVEAASKASIDLSTYWSNSVRPYALMGSPFLRPPVAASIWQVSLEAVCDIEMSEACLLVTTVDIKAAHEKRMLELQVQCKLCPMAKDAANILDGSVVLSGFVWCFAAKAGPRLDGVVVPPVPSSVDAMSDSQRRWRSLKQKSQNIPLVKPASSEIKLSACAGKPSSCWLSDSDGAEADIAAVYGRQMAPVIPPADACGDVSPLFAVALQAALAAFRESGSVPAALSLDFELPRALPPSAMVEVCARSEALSTHERTNHAEVVVTGWHGSEAVLRLRASRRCSEA